MYAMENDDERWWNCPLDVQGLATTAVEAARGAVQEAAISRCQQWQVTTTGALITSAFSALENLRVGGRRADGWAPLSGFFEAKDGWIRLHGNYPHHARASLRALGATDKQSLQKSLSRLDAEEAEEAVIRAGGIAAAVRTPEQWQLHPQEIATCGDPWFSVKNTGSRRTLDGGSLPMEGVRVLDLTRVIAGPTCSQLFACLGADVLRVDPPGRPELEDQYYSNAMGKRSVVADWGEHQDNLEDLLAEADVVLLGYRPRSLTSFGLDPDDLLSRHGHLIVASLSAWGESGPWGGRSGFDSIIQAASGIASLCGTNPVDKLKMPKPGALPVQALDHATGSMMAAEIIKLLTQAEAGVVRISLLGAARELKRLPRVSASAVTRPADAKVCVAAPGGVLSVAPPPLMLGGRTMERDVLGYGTAALVWR